MEWWQLYLLAVLPSIRGGLHAIGFLLGVTCIAVAIAGAAMRDHYDADKHRESIEVGKKLHARLPAMFGVVLVIIMATSVIPSERGLMLMLGGYVVTNTDGVERLPENFVGAANAFLERYAESGNE